MTKTENQPTNPTPASRTVSVANSPPANVEAQAQPLIPQPSVPVTGPPTKPKPLRLSLFGKLRLTHAAIATAPGSKEVIQFKAGPTDAYPAPHVTNDDMKLVAQCSKLFFLKINNSGITDAGLLELAPLKGILSLDISGNFITDRGFAVVENFDGLDLLTISDTRITDDGLCLLAKSARPRSLHANNLGITDTGAECLANITSIMHLHLAHSSITNAGLGSLTTMRRMLELDISGTKINDEGLVHLQEFPRLRELDLSECDIHGPGLKYVSNLPIEWLKLNGTNIDDSAIEHLAKLKKCLVIEIRHTHITPEGVAALKRALPNTGIRYTDRPAPPPFWTLDLPKLPQQQ